LQLPPGQLSVQVEPFSHFMSQLPPAQVSLHPALPLDEQANLQFPSAQAAFAVAVPPALEPLEPLEAVPPLVPAAGPPVIPACFGAPDFGTSLPVTALPVDPGSSLDPDPDPDGSETSVEGLVVSGAPFLTVQLDIASTTMQRPDPVMCLIFIFHLADKRALGSTKVRSCDSCRSAL
jgi:hypothetical protein